MNLNEDTIKDIAKQLGLSGNGHTKQSTIDYLSSKSDAELEREILKIKETLKKNNIPYEKQVALLKNIAPMMDAKQRARLGKVMEILKK